MASSPDPSSPGLKPPTDPAKELVLFLLGKTGHGKSSTGNTVLGRHAFQTSDDAESQTFITQSGWTRIGETIVQVVDGPGVCETRLSKGDAAKKMIDDMSRGVLLCPDGFDGLVIVCRYGIRFTDEEHQAVEALKSVFGQNFIRDFGLIVFTHGEEMDLKNKKAKTPQTFEGWCSRQTGKLKDLMAECGDRCLLFRNMEDDDLSQVQTLLDTVARMKERGVRYTKDMFQSIKEEQEKFFIRENAEHLRSEVRKKVGLLQDGLSRVVRLCGAEADLETLEPSFAALQRDIEAMRAEITANDKGTGVLDSLKGSVDSIEMTLAMSRSRLKDATKSEDLQREIEELRDQLSQNEENLMKAQKDNDDNALDKFTNAIKMIGDMLLKAAPAILKIMEIRNSTNGRALEGGLGPREPYVQMPSSDEDH